MELQKRKLLASGLSEAQTEIRFELFEWLKNKNLSVNEACELLELTRNEIRRSALEEKL